ncbi:M48 family metallopeptidase [Hyphobacterium sp. CCMP332]|uniref:M48 family metallopeptidase n=1 Tax=Hyphobacterium sp. CCMP332 TaxID=2749086 RepID=UPI00164FDD05|nr:M48 family metallopeptidase [Hyphobacterium sp. CCMP332]QNL18809.1 M48 family metallopeptidase [Hyphobacterium sp. CCMP332]
MMGAVGLRTHIWNNNLKSILLLAGFPFLLMLLAFAAALVLTGMGGDTYSSGQGVMDLGADFSAAIDSWPTMALWSIIIAGIWFVIAWFGHQTMIDMATGAQSVTRQEEPELYNLLENLCISRGITMPKLKVIETDMMNAYASGLTDKQYTVTVTRGLMAKLNKAELEAVLAHELSHILNRDVRLLVISVIFVGIFSFVAQIVFRSLFWGGLGGRSSGRRGNAALLMIIAIAIVAVAYFLAIAIRFALSRKREYMADAGAVELTRNPDAMISALEKISGHAEMDNAPDGVREMMIENPKAGFAGVFATHPPIEKRIEALIEFAGGQRRVRSTSVPSV